MIACPSSEALRDLLIGVLSDPDADPLRDHLGRCPACLSELDRLSDDPELARWMADGLKGSDRESATDLVRDFVRAARDAALATTWGPTAPSPNLGPSDRDGDGDGDDNLGQIGPYRVAAVLGRGGMGVVLRAFDDQLQRMVAVKVIHDGPTSESARARFVREARAAARVEHDHIVRVYAVASPPDGPPYLVMEYLDGSTLGERIRLGHRLDPREAAGVVAEVADGLAAAHAAGLVHRDIKPSNILFDSPTGRAKIVDFGLARALARPIVETQDGAIGGTPAYMSPEQAEGRDDLDGRSDLYSLGVTLYEALTGDLPFRGTPQMVLRQVLTDEPKPPRRLNDAVPRDLETVCLKAMAKEPARRYAGAAEFAADLRRWLAGAPIQARPVGRFERSWRLARRHPTVTALSATIILATAAGVGGVFWQWRRAEANAREANGYLGKTLDSIDNYFVKISQNRLLDVPNLQPLRRELLQAARDYYEALLRDRPHDPVIAGELAKARTSLALVVSLVGTTDEAIALFGQSLAEFDRLVARSPGDQAPRHGRLTCQINLGKVQMGASKFADAAATYRRLLEEGEALRRDRPHDAEPLQAIYAARHGLASVAFNQGGDPAAIVAGYREALRINDQLLARAPDHPPYLRNLSRSAGMLVAIHSRQGQRGETVAALDQSYRATAKLVADHPESQDYRFALAALERQRGLIPFEDSLKLQGPNALAKFDEARSAFARAITLDRALVRENPRLDIYRSDFLALFLLTSAIETAAGRFQEIITLLREARDISSAVANPQGDMGFTRPTMVSILLVLASAHAELGQVDEALRVVDEADRLLGSLTPAERSRFPASAPQELVNACNRAQILHEAGRLTDSVPAWDRACAVCPPPLLPLIAFVREMHRAEAKLGPAPDPRRALAAAPLADMFCAGMLLDGGNNFLYARLYALAAPAAPDPTASESLAARALFRLEKARDANYFRDPHRLDQIDADPVFAPLRERPDYQKFRQTCQAPPS